MLLKHFFHKIDVVYKIGHLYILSNNGLVATLLARDNSVSVYKPKCFRKNKSVLISTN